MKLAPWTALAAIGLFLVAITVGRGKPVEAAPVPLDLRGIDTVEIDGYVDVTFVAKDPLLSGGRARNDEVKVTRKGRTLKIDAQGSYGLEVHLTPNVRTLAMGHGEIDATVRIEALEVRSSGGTSIAVSAGELRVIDMSPLDQRCCSGEGSCGGHVTIADSDIDVLHARSEAGSVTLKQPQRLGRITLELGPRARFDLEGLRGIPKLDVVPFVPAAGTTVAAAAADRRRACEG